MTYRCQVCKNVSQPGEKRTLWPMQRTRPGTVHQEIEREIPVCFKCQSILVSGIDIFILMKCNGEPSRLPLVKSKKPTSLKKKVEPIRPEMEDS